MWVYTEINEEIIVEYIELEHGGKLDVFTR